VRRALNKHPAPIGGPDNKPEYYGRQGSLPDRR
jgi:hypothetical protein